MIPKRGIDNMSFPPHPLAPGGGGVPGPSGRHVGKLYLAGVSARAAAAQCKQDHTNVLLATTNKIQPSTPSAPVAHLPNESLPLDDCVQMNTQPPVKESTNQHLNTPLFDEDHAPHIYKDDDVPQITNDPLLSNNLNEDEINPLCAACHLCRDPNSDTDDYHFVLIAIVMLTPSARSRWISKLPHRINLLLHIWIFATEGKSALRKHPVLMVGMWSLCIV